MHGSAGRGRFITDARGQAMTETLLVTMTLVMVLALVLQVFLVDEHVFRLATAAHYRAFVRVAFPNNRANAGYSTVKIRWDGPDQYTPVVGFFRPFGLTSDDMRIRSVRTPPPPGGSKEMVVGSGAAPSITGGLPDGIDSSVWLSLESDAFADLNRARQLAQESTRPPAGR